MVKAVRGAIGIERDDAHLIGEGVRKLARHLLEMNRIQEPNIISIAFSQTADLVEANPATALRKDGFANVPLFCSQEPEYKGSMPRVIRILVTYNTEERADPVPVYLDGAEKLRSDITD